MAKVEKLFQRLDRLEAEYRDLLLDVCRRYLGGEYSWAAARAMHPQLFSGKKWRDEEAAHVERLEKEIENLRRKLSLPITESPITGVRRLRTVLEVNGMPDKRKLLIDFVARMEAVGRAM